MLNETSKLYVHIHKYYITMTHKGEKLFKNISKEKKQAYAIIILNSF